MRFQARNDRAVGSSLRRPIGLESLETRRLLAAAIRTYDGTGNNLEHPDWGSAGEQFVRTAPAAYGDGISSPAGQGRPSPRLISNVLSIQDEDEDILDDQFLSAFVYAWGQFLDHDLDLAGSSSPAQPFNVPVPRGDPQFDPAGTGTKVINLNRSDSDPSTGTSRRNPRQQVNTITAWIDASMIYGSDASRAAALRTFVDGKLRTSAGDLMPFNTGGLANANDAHIVPDNQLFVAGDVRANENIELSSLHTLFLREHNRLAGQIKASNPRWSDEQIYQQARAIVGAEIQVITYNEFLPAVLGGNALRQYRGYDKRVNPGIANEFAAASFRLHSMIGNDVEFLDAEGEEVRDELSLAGAFFNPPVVRQTGVGPILKYLASDPMQEVDTKVVFPLRNFLFGPPGAGGFDLVSLNIQRGRDHGLADYNTTRAAYGLPKVRSFSDITSDRAVQQQLKNLYGSVDNIDLWAGGLAEDHVGGGATVGPLIQRILADQFQRLRDGDRFWYERQFSGAALDSIKRTTLASLIRRNTEIDNLQDNVFVFKVTISGTVFSDANGNGRRDNREDGIQGIAIELEGEEGVIDTVMSDRNGKYTFAVQALGELEVRQAPPAGAKASAAASKAVAVRITKGMSVTGVDIARSPSRNSTPTPPKSQPQITSRTYSTRRDFGSLSSRFFDGRV